MSLVDVRLVERNFGPDQYHMVSQFRLRHGKQVRVRDVAVSNAMGKQAKHHLLTGTVANRCVAQLDDLPVLPRVEVPQFLDHQLARYSAA